MLIGKRIAVMFACVALAVTAAVGQTVDPCTQTTALTGGTNLTMTGHQGTGTLSGTSYHYEIWVDQGGASGAALKWYGADKGGGAAYRASWTNPDDYLGRIGYYWGNGSTYTAYKNMYCDFNYTRSGRSTAGDYSYIGIYGWSRNSSATNANERLIEFYIVEDWFGNQWQNDNTPITTSTTGGSSIGSFTVDGATYSVIKNVRENKPSIDGDKTFTQIFSVRQTNRKCGSISITEHFKKWESLGLTMGNLYEAKFLTEAGGGEGWLDLSYLKFSQEESPRGSVTPPVDPCIANPNAAGCVPATNPCDNAPAGSTDDPTGNLVKGGTFPGTSLPTNWTLNTGSNYGGSAATATVCKNTAHITVTTAGEESYQPQLVQQNISLVGEQTYTLTFIASGSGTMGAMLQEVTDWKEYGEPTDVTLTSTPKAYTLVVKMPNSDDKVQLAFNLGNVQNVSISGVKLLNTTTPSSISTGIAASVRNSAPLVSVKGAMLNVSSPNSGELMIRMIDVKGKTVAKFNAIGGGKYSLAGIPAGRYFVDMKGAGVRQTAAVVVK